jgi:excisionase family DNA binding protein
MGLTDRYREENVMQESNDTLLTAKEVADRLRVNIKTVQKWIASGELAAIDLGQAYRVSEVDLQMFLGNRRRRRVDRNKPVENDRRQFKTPSPPRERNK